MENLTARYKVTTVGLEEEIDAVSFQTAALQMLQNHGFTSVQSILVEWDNPNGGTIEFVECRIVDEGLEYRTGRVLDVKDETEETRERLYLFASGRAGALVFDGIYWRVNERRLEPNAVIRRYDEIAGEWFEGTVGRVSSYDQGEQERVYSLHLVVAGYAPSPLQVGDIIEIVTESELYHREMDKRNQIFMENREKPWLPFHDGE